MSHKFSLVVSFVLAAIALVSAMVVMTQGPTVVSAELHNANGYALAGVNAYGTVLFLEGGGSTRNAATASVANPQTDRGMLVVLQ